MRERNWNRFTPAMLTWLKWNNFAMPCSTFSLQREGNFLDSIRRSSWETCWILISRPRAETSPKLRLQSTHNPHGVLKCHRYRSLSLAVWISDFNKNYLSLTRKMFNWMSSRLIQLFFFKVHTMLRAMKSIMRLDDGNISMIELSFFLSSSLMTLIEIHFVIDIRRWVAVKVKRMARFFLFRIYCISPIPAEQFDDFNNFTLPYVFCVEFN